MTDFYVVTKFILPSIGDLRFSNLHFDNTCAYMDNKNAQNTETRKYMLDLRTFCKKIEPFVIYYRRLIKSYNHTVQNILENEINLILPQIPGKQICGISIMLVSSFIGLAYGSISSFLHHRQNKTLHRAVNAMNNKANIQHNKLIQLFVGQHSSIIFKSFYAHPLGLHHYFINSLLYLRTTRDKYITLYRELISQLHIYASAIRILAKVCLPNTLVTPFKLKEILSKVRKTLQVTNPNYDLVIDRLHLYYDIHLVTFGIDRVKNLIVQFPISVQPHMQQPLILHQLETVPVPILDQNDRAHSYTHLQVEKSYIALNSETYISLRQQELRTCKRIDYKFYCVELL